MGMVWRRSGEGRGRGGREPGTHMQACRQAEVQTQFGTPGIVPTFGLSAPFPPTAGHPRHIPGPAREPSPTPLQRSPSPLHRALAPVSSHHDLALSQSLIVGTQVGLQSTSEPVRVAGRKQALSLQSQQSSLPRGSPSHPGTPFLSLPWGACPLPTESDPFWCMASITKDGHSELDPWGKGKQSLRSRGGRAEAGGSCRWRTRLAGWGLLRGRPCR